MKPWATGKSNDWKRGGNEPVYSQQFVVMAWMRPRHEMIRAVSEIEALKRKVEIGQPQHLAMPSKDRCDPETLCEYSLFDHHFGMLAWGQETGGPNYDIKIARRCYERALADLVGRTRQYSAARSLIVLGNDQQNFDNRSGTTTKGTPQDTDVRYQKVFGISRDASIWAIEALLQVSRRVDVVIVSGNHDSLASWHLGDSLAAWFRNCDRVTIDNRPLFRKYFRFGVNMLMFTHGNCGKLEQYDKTMAAEQPRLWGQTLWREAHTGDKHHRRVIELKGATVRVLPSLRPPDAWTSENHFVGSIRAAEAFVWHRKRGLMATATHSIL